MDNSKKGGIYYTPEALARVMAEKLKNEKPASILEPSCGQGVFLPLLSYLFPKASIVALDIDPRAISFIQKNKPKIPGLSLSCQNFLDFFKLAKKAKSPPAFDLIIGNPPYIRYQNLSEKERRQIGDILTKEGLKANKLTNLWAVFLLLSMDLLAPSGILAFILPSELFQAAYARQIRQKMEAVFSSITVIDFENQVFPKIQQKTLLLYGKKGPTPARFRYLLFPDIPSFKDADLSSYSYISAVPDGPLFLQEGQPMATLEQIKTDSRFMTLGQAGKVQIGVTTGDNDYFCLDKETVKAYKLESVSLPLLRCMKEAGSGIYLTEKRLVENTKKGCRTFLLSLPALSYDRLPERTKTYLQLGEKKGTNRRYKCRIRPYWYHLSPRTLWIPDFFLSRKIYRFPRLLENQAKALCTDNMLRMKCYKELAPEDVLLSFYNSITFAFIELYGHRYGGGLLEILPSVSEKIPVPNLFQVPDKALKKKLLKRLTAKLYQQDPIEEILFFLDHQLLVSQLHIPESWCQTCHRFWQKARQKRLQKSSY